jgi:hypothetical protein
MTEEKALTRNRSIGSLAVDGGRQEAYGGFAAVE